jgi:hypothetical protein
MLAVLLALVAALAASPTAASGGAPRVAVLEPDGELLRAVALALAPWGLETVRSDTALPVASQPEAVQMASRVAEQLDVQALVWITRAQSGSALWVFDASAGDVTVRMLAETPPFDSAAAAAVALSVKTVLRTSSVAPPEERLGSTPEPPDVRRSAALEAGAGYGWVARDALDLRLKFAGVAWLTSAQNLGVSFAVASGPGLPIDNPDFRGRYRELTASGEARLRLVRIPGFTANIALGAAVHWAALEGTLARDAREVDVDRVNASLELATAINVDVAGPVYLGACARGGYFPRYRRYLVAGTPVFSPWPLAVTLEGYVGAELF